MSKDTWKTIGAKFLLLRLKQDHPLGWSLILCDIDFVHSYGIINETQQIHNYMDMEV